MRYKEVMKFVIKHKNSIQDFLALDEIVPGKGVDLEHLTDEFIEYLESTLKSNVQYDMGIDFDLNIVE